MSRFGMLKPDSNTNNPCLDLIYCIIVYKNIKIVLCTYIMLYFFQVTEYITMNLSSFRMMMMIKVGN